MGLSVRLPELFQGIDVRLPPRAEEVDVRSLAVDSRKVGAGALFAALKGIAADGALLVSMEVSSHALAQERVAGCTFAAAAFTNLTRDHLDYHGTMEAYFEAKARLFRDLLPAGAPAVLNLDDPQCAALARERPGSIGFTVRGEAGARLEARDLSSDLEGLRFDLRGELGEARIESPLVGAHNAENLLAALG